MSLDQSIVEGGCYVCRWTRALLKVGVIYVLDQSIVEGGCYLCPWTRTLLMVGVIYVLGTEHCWRWVLYMSLDKSIVEGGCYLCPWPEHCWWWVLFMSLDQNIVDGGCYLCLWNRTLLKVCLTYFLRHEHCWWLRWTRPKWNWTCCTGTSGCDSITLLVLHYNLM